MIFSSLASVFKPAAKHLTTLILMGSANFAFAHADFTVLNGGGPLITSSSNSTGHPAVIRIPSWVTEKADPRANYYMYYGDHNGKKHIPMKWAANIDGPWTDYNCCGGSSTGVFGGNIDSFRNGYKHIAHPDVWVDNDKQEIVLFFHAKTKTVGAQGQNHSQFVARSPNGLDFNDASTTNYGTPGYGPHMVTLNNGATVDMPIASNYMRVFRKTNTPPLADDWYAVSKRGVIEKAPDANNPYAPNPAVYADGISKSWQEPDRTADAAAYIAMLQNYSVTDDISGAPWGAAYSSPVCTFTASKAFAEHPNNPNNIIDNPTFNNTPNTNGYNTNTQSANGISKSIVTCLGGNIGDRFNHVGINYIEEDELLEMYFYVKEVAEDFQSGDDYFPDIYRFTLDVSDADYKNWDLAIGADGKELFDVYMTVDAVNDDSSLSVRSMGNPDIFIDDDEQNYFFFGYVPLSQPYADSSPFNRNGANQGEGAIGSLQVQPNCNNGIDDDRDGNVDYPDDPGCDSPEDRSEITGIIIPTDIAGSVDVSGDEYVTGVLTAGVVSDSNGAENTRYTWYSSADNFTTALTTGVNSNQYTVQTADETYTIKLVASYEQTDGNGTANAENISGVIGAKPQDPNLGASVTIVDNNGGDIEEGDMLTAAVSDANGSDSYNNIVLTWNSNTQTDFIGNTYTVSADDEGGNVTVNADYTDNDDYAESVTAFVAVPISASNTVGSVSITGNEAVNTLQTAVISDPNNITNVSYQWKLDGNNTGLDQNTFTPTDAGSLTVTVRYDDDFGAEILESAAKTINAEVITPPEPTPEPTPTPPAVASGCNYNPMARSFDVLFIWMAGIAFLYMRSRRHETAAIKVE